MYPVTQPGECIHSDLSKLYPAATKCYFEQDQIVRLRFDDCNAVVRVPRTSLDLIIRMSPSI